MPEDKNKIAGEQVSPIEMELNAIIDEMAGEYDDVKIALNNFKGRVMADFILKSENKIRTLESLISIIGGQDGRVMQLLTFIDSAK